MLLLGNDIIDLNEAGTREKSQDTRFIQRVFSAQERDSISASNHPDLTLWMLWAAKEIAFKLISKICGPPVFSHPKFQISDLQPTAAASFRTRAVYQKHAFPILIQYSRNHIHAIGGNLPTDVWPHFSMKSGAYEIAPPAHATWGNTAVWNETFTQAERESIHHAASALVRFFCKKSIAETLKIRPSQLQIIRPVKKQQPQPPFVLLNGKPCNIDISLSHHGSWLGWCFSADRSSHSCRPTTSAGLRHNRKTLREQNRQAGAQNMRRRKPSETFATISPPSYA